MRNLRIRVQLNDHQGTPVANASVSIDLFQHDGIWGSGIASTGDDSSVTFQGRGAGTGFYRTNVAAVNAALPTWIGVTLANRFQKP